jgi:hypothetical protein
MDLIGMLWEASPVFMTRDDFAKSLEGWDIEAMHNDRGEVAVIFASKGPAFHFCKIDPQFQATKAVLAKYPGSLIDRYGYATTSTPKTDMRMLRFNRALGFHVTGEDALDIHQRIDSLRHTTKETQCQSPQSSAA